VTQKSTVIRMTVMVTSFGQILHAFILHYKRMLWISANMNICLKFQAQGGQVDVKGF
jgi:hypothetical protein